jgi:hypothetical protein
MAPTQDGSSAFDAVAKHDPSLLPLSPDIKYAETGRFIKLGEGIWKNAGAPTYRMELFDPQTGGIGVEAVLPDGGVPTVLALRTSLGSGAVEQKLSSRSSSYGRR